MHYTPVLLAIALIALAPAQADVRERLIVKEAADAKALAEFTFRGFDGSDTAVRASAAHYCGTTKECQASFIAARDSLLRLAAIQGREKPVLKLLKSNAQAGFVDWRLADKLYQNTYHPDPLPRSRLMVTRCSTYFGKNSVHTRCATF